MRDQLESPPPPVPPKDQPQPTPYELETMGDASLSASKRKREAAADSSHGDLSIDDNTPKRTRMSPVEDYSGENDNYRTPGTAYLRRKKGVSNLSTMSLRHQALQQERDMEAQQSGLPRPSKFQEGSLNDKPSQKPSSTFIRDDDEAMASFERFENMAAEYNDSDISIAKDDIATTPFAHPYARTANTQVQEGGILARFGQKIANTFRPGPMWSKIWNETKEELILKNIEAAERKRLQKEQAEAKYASMKRRGKVPIKRSSFAYLGSFSARDSGIGFGKHEHNVSRFSLQPSFETATLARDHDEEGDDTEDRGNSTLRGRLHFKRPSLSNIRSDLKRARSELSLGQIATRESSRSTLSPAKQDCDAEFLARSHSKADLRKQQKLSKRVSDLEVKLQTAREELGEALAQASPMPRLGSNYERFTPSTMRKSTFVPGGLPSLPSESLFDSGFMSTSNVSSMRQSMLSEDIIDSLPDQQGHHHSRHDKDDNEKTIKAHPPRPYPTLASTIFESSTHANAIDDANHERRATSHTEAIEEPKVSATDDNLADPTYLTSQAQDQLKPDVHVNDSTPTKSKAAADSPTTTSSKKARARKRKVRHEDAAYKPHSDDDSDSGGKTSKKQKSTAGIWLPNHKQALDASKTSTRGAANTTASTNTLDEEEAEDDQTEDNEGYNFGEEEDDLAHNEDARRSIDSSVHSLEPVYEEDEESIMIAVNGSPLKPTATATPARFGHIARGPSPAKRQTAVKAGAEEVIIKRAANAVKKHPGRLAANARRHHHHHQKEDADFQWPEDVF